MKLTAAAGLAFCIGFAVMFCRNARPIEHNMVTGRRWRAWPSL
ncbi:hypothetical protein JZX82_gp69 [Gordonia phage William]|uniref:Uncharacterized protein n=1 Tax=Gordonia phage William TaxID=2571253 RepID=A0A4Y6EQ66_9CAUD|nr:hypothetical protein JZX82_gp69 [Gordonia phage William]QDF17164.1 hypothetical protein SEA_WILLIAM_69 [Gordonia phage William]